MPAYSAELRKREEAIGIHPDPVVAAMMDAMSLEGHKHSILTDLTLRILGLEVCSETQIGNEMIRGVSGGQKKRVTSGELLVGPARVLLMDSISTGLDSSTTHLIISCLRNVCHLLDTTICVSLLQPPPEVFDLFDDVMVLSEGYLIYHGPREEIPGFFNGLGFEIPERKEVADFLQEITSRKDQGQYRIDQSKRNEFMPVKDIYNAFQKSPMGQAMAKELSSSPVPPPLAVTSDGDKNKALAPFATDALVRKKYALSNWQVFKAMADRDSLLFSRNSFLYIFQEFQTCLVGAMATTLFLKVNYTKTTFQDGQVYLGLLFFCAMTAMWNVFAESESLFLPDTLLTLSSPHLTPPNSNVTISGHHVLLSASVFQAKIHAALPCMGLHSPCCCDEAALLPSRRDSLLSDHVLPNRPCPPSLQVLHLLGLPHSLLTGWSDHVQVHWGPGKDL